MRFALGVEYDGSPYHGWQIQKGTEETIQQYLEGAIAKVADHPVGTCCAGRTDAGVHAVGQVVHFESNAERGLRNWLLGINVNLPESIRVNWVEPVSTDFHARFSAISRSYRYIILNRSVGSAIWHNRAFWVHRTLDAERMAEAGEPLLGEHDFTSYRAAGCQSKSPFRNLTRLTVTREADRILVELTANAFLHHMVRNIVGVLVAIGSGEREIGWAAEVLASRDRRLGGVTAPAEGLYLMQVDYPENYRLPENPPF